LADLGADARFFGSTSGKDGVAFPNADDDIEICAVFGAKITGGTTIALYADTGDTFIADASVAPDVFDCI